MSTWRDLPFQPRRVGVASPYYEWARATRFTHYGAAEWLPVLIELRKTTAEKFARRLFMLQRKKDRGWASGLRLPPFYASPPTRMRRPTRFVSGIATRKFLRDVYDGAMPSAFIQTFEIGKPLALSSVNTAPTPAPDWTDNPPTVVTVVIDDGIAFAHQRFLSADGTTRIEYFWDQLAPSAIWGEWNYGRQWTKRDPADGIDARMQRSRYGGHLDEDEVYREAGLVDQRLRGHKPLALRGAHGTHVLDLAANGASAPAAGVRPIIAVQLPTATTADTSGATLAPQIYNGLLYALARTATIEAAAGTAQLPVVANVSYGLIAGPHDGTSLLEAAIEDLLAACNTPGRPPVRVVFPAGNSHLARCHAWFDLDSGASQELQWRVLPDDWTESYLEIWFARKADVAAISVTIAVPDGTTTNAFIAGVVQEYEYAGSLAARATFYPPGAVGACAMLRLTVARTGSPDGGVPLAPAGLWRVTLSNIGKKRVRNIHAWIQRDDTPVGYPRRGRQSYFDDPAYARTDDGGRAIESDAHALTEESYVKRRATVNAIATGAGPIVVGGVRRSDWKAAPYSASGPVVHHPPGRGLQTPDGPDALTISDDTPFHLGVLAAGSRSGSCVSMQGTSVAAPQIARWVADELARGRAGGRAAVAAYTQKVVNPPRYSERTPPPGAAPKPPRERGGRGRIELESFRKPRAERE